MKFTQLVKHLAKLIANPASLASGVDRDTLSDAELDKQEALEATTLIRSRAAHVATCATLKKRKDERVAANKVKKLATPKKTAAPKKVVYISQFDGSYNDRRTDQSDRRTDQMSEYGTHHTGKGHPT